MSGLLFELRPARLALAGLGRPLGRAAVVRLGPPLRLATLPQPLLPGPAWARLRPLVAGICGSDVAQATLDADLDSPLSGLPSFPHVMGHEVVAEVVEGAADGSGPRPGSVVAVDPWLGCLARGIEPPCAACAAGLPPRCAHHFEPAAPGAGRGMHLGHIAGLPGGFGGEMVAHSARLHPLPDGVSPAAAVLCDPLAVAGHALDGCAGALDGGGPVLVLGAGTIGLGVVATLRARRPDLAVLVSCAWSHLAAEARRLGATSVPAPPDAIVAAVARAVPGARLERPMRGGRWLSAGGAACVVDTIGTARTLGTALRAVRPGGRVVSVGVGRSGHLQTTLAYFKEVAVQGANGYGGAADGGGVFDEAFALLGSGAVPAARWLTHTVPLRDWRRAFAIAAAPGRHAAIKVSLRPAEP